MSPVALTPGQGALIWVALASVACLALLFWGFFSLKKKRLIENVPTSKTKGVFMGLNEVKGRVRTELPIRSYLRECDCAYYRYTVEEHYRRTVTHTDSKGRTRTRTESGWKTIDSGEELMPFLLEDDTGRLRVDPQGARIEAARVFSTRSGRSSSLYYAKGPPSSISNSTHQRKFTEWALRLGETVYVMGMARFNEDLEAPEIRADKQAELFLISTRSEAQITRAYALGAFFKLFFGTLLAFAIPIGLALPKSADLGDALRNHWQSGALFAAIYGGVIGGYYLAQIYNGLVSVRERLAMAMSMIDVQLRRRHVLIPRLAAVVKAATDHEEGAHTRVAEARAGSLEEQNASLRRIFALAEDYPDLKTSKNFLKLQAALAGTETRIALAREFFNGTVRAYNDRIATLPDSLVAKLAGYRPEQYFAAKGFERIVPKVQADPATGP